MHIGPRHSVIIAVALALAAGCQSQLHTESSGQDFRGSVSGADWELMQLGGAPAPTGASGRRATINFDADTAHAGGFSGCNSYGGTYTVSGDSLRFGPIIMTKMACSEGMELEQHLAAALDSTRRYEFTPGQLTLVGSSGQVAMFTRATQ